MSLQYRKPAAAAARPAVDWEAYEETMARVDPVYSDPRFDSLKHVLQVLSSPNAEQELAELRDQRAAIEELVDAVVEGYHSGFNRAIHAYSRILRLFTESRLQLESLRRSLEAARRRLSAQSRGLVAQYGRDLQLSDTLRLLDDIQACVDVPGRVQRLEESKEWALAVSVLLDGCNKLAREELAAVGALAELTEEMGRRRAALQASLVAELEARVYRLDSAGAAADGGEGGGDAGNLLPGGGGGGGGVGVPRLLLSSPSLQRRPGSSGSQEVDHSSAAGNLSGRGLPPRPPSALGRTPSYGKEGGLAALAAGGGDVAAGLPAMPRRPVHRRAQTLGGLMPAGMGLTAVDGHLVDPELPLTALVDCVAQLGGLHDAQAALRRHMPRQLRGVISRALDSFPTAQRLPPDEYALDQHAAAAATAADDISVPAPVAATAAALAEHVLGACLQVFQQTNRLLQALAAARVPKASSGLELLLRQQQRAAEVQRAHRARLAGAGAEPAAPLPPPPVGPPSAEATRAEAAAAWECLQLECQRLLADMLGAPPPVMSASRLDDGGDVPLAGWLASVNGELEAAGAASAAAAQAAADSGALTFSLEWEVEGLLTRADAAAGQGGPDAAPGGGDDAAAAASVRERMRRILGGHPGGPALVAALYRPVLGFAEAAERQLGGPAGGAAAAEPAGRMAALLGGWRGGAESPGADRSLLRSYLESFLRMEFLPAVYVSARARCSAALEDPEAFKPRTRLRAPYREGAGPEGRPLLPAALAAERMVEDLLGWAAQVPPFATHLTGVVENVLGRVADAFEAAMAGLLGRSAAGRLAEALPLVQLMAREPAAALLGSPVAFFVGRNTEAMESFVSSVIAAGFGANDEGVECEVLRRLLAERPLPARALLAEGGDVGRLAALAALSDSLDYVADVIHRCTGGGGPGGAGAGRAGSGAQLLNRADRHSTDSSGGSGSGAATPLGGEAAAAGVAGSGGSASGATWQQQLGSRFRTWRRTGSGEAGGLTEGLSHLADRHRALAGQCARALRLDLLLLVLHHLQQLPASSYVCESEEEAREVDECVAALNRVVARLDDGLEPYLPPHKRSYAFACLAPAAARYAVWLLPDIAALNPLGVQRMCRMLASLQPALGGLGGGGGAGSFRPEAVRQFDRAKLYYTLLTYSAEGLVATAAEKPHRFSADEYRALLASNVVGRPVSPEQRAALQRVLADAARGAPKPAARAPAAAALQGAFAKAVQGAKSAFKQ